MWSEVVRELDHPGFQITSRAGFELLIRGLMRGLGTESFPVDVLFTLWKNKEGQVSMGFFLCWVKVILELNIFIYV